MPGALFYEREKQNRCGYHPTATMDHHSRPVIGANPGHSVLLDMTARSSPKVLIAQTPNLLSAASEQYAPFRQSFGEVQARLFRKMATKSASNLPHAPIKGDPHRSDSEATVEHSPINHQHQPTTSQPPANH